MRRLLCVVLSALLLAVAGYGVRRQEGASRPGVAAGASAATQAAPLRLPLAEPSIVITKGARRLVLYDGARALRTYRVALGLSPVEDKVRQGDNRTPEGDFYVFTKNGRSAFYLSLGLSYPNAEDAERGLRDRLITRAEHRRILSALRRRAAPPMNTALGGDIYIHGGGNAGDWTWGCVALANEDIRELFAAVPVGTRVRIEH